jgi:hypothetical protein
MLNDIDNKYIENDVKVPYGISDFLKLINSKCHFADKSHFIKEIINDSAEVILITRPRRFGKTLNLSMLYYFLQQNFPQKENIFKNLAISQDINFCKKHQNQHPVIFITFNEIKEDTFKDAKDKVATLISELYTEHQYLLEENILYEHEKKIFAQLLNEEASKSHIQGAIKKLALYMKRKYKKLPIILIDEYDTPIQTAYLKGYYPKMITFMRGILGQALKDNKIIQKAIVTGITRVAQESLFSGINNLEVYSLLREKYGQYFGFTETEVIKLITETKQEVPLQEIKEWYNGYQIGKYTLYNPWSIISCLRNHGKLGQHWLNTSSNDLIAVLLSKAKIDIKHQFEELLQGNSIEQPLSENLVFADLETQEEALWSLLLYAGYLNVLSTKLHGSRLIAKISIPNKEVGIVYDKIVEHWFSKAISLDSYDKLVRSLACGEIDRFKAHLSSYILQTGSYFDFNSNTSEQIFHVFVLGLVVGLRDNYIINSNQESGLGRFDVILIPKNKQYNGILLEFKAVNKAKDLMSKAEEALEQIKDKQYFQIFKQHDVKNILAIGLAFCGKQMELVHEEIKLNFP